MLGVPLDAPHRRFLAIETAVSIAINSLIPTAIIWRLGVQAPASLWGPSGLVLTLVKACLLCVFLMTTILTLIIRLRVGAGLAPTGTWSREGPRWLRLTPRHLLLRAAVFALATLAVLVPTVTLIVALAGRLPFGPGMFVAFNLAFGALMGLLAAPFIVIAALSDPIRRKASPRAA